MLRALWVRLKKIKNYKRSQYISSSSADMVHWSYMSIWLWKNVARIEMAF